MSYIHKITIKNNVITASPYKQFELPEKRKKEYERRLEIFLKFIEECKIDFDITFAQCLGDSISHHSFCSREEFQQFPIKIVGYSCDYIDKNYYVLIPNVYLQYRLDTIIEDISSIPFEEKMNKALFIGHGNPVTRIQFNKEVMQSDIKLLDHINYYDGSDKKDQWMTKKEQLNYKYLIDIDGIGTSFDRPIWILNSNSVLFVYEHNKKIDHWKHLIKEDIHYVKFNCENLDEKITYYNNNPKLCLDIIKNANRFVKEIFNYEKLRTDTYNSIKILL